MFKLFKTHCEAGGGGSLLVGRPEKNGERTVTLSLNISSGGSLNDPARKRRKPPSRIRRDQERRKAWLESRSTLKKVDRPSVIVGHGVPGAGAGAHAEMDEDGVGDVEGPVAVDECVGAQQRDLDLGSQGDVELVDVPGHNDGENTDCEKPSYFQIDSPIKVSLHRTINKFTFIRCESHHRQFLFTSFALLNNFACKICKKTKILRCEDGFLIDRNTDISDDNVRREIFES